MDQTWLLAVFLLSVRITALSMLAPVLGGSYVSPSIRLAISLVLGMALVQKTTPVSAHILDSSATIVLAIAREATLGATMALGVNMAFAIFGLGARIVDVQIGYGMGQVFDPMTRQQLPIISAIVNWLALIAFLLLGGYYNFIQGMSMSVLEIPPGHGWNSQSALQDVVTVGGKMFSLGFLMFAPVISAITLIEVGFGVISKSLPQLNVLAIAIPVKVLVGLALLALWVTRSTSSMEQAFRTAFSVWEALWH